MQSLLLTIGLCLATVTASQFESPLSHVNFFKAKFFSQPAFKFGDFDFDAYSPFWPFFMKSGMSSFADMYKSGSQFMTEVSAKDIFQNPVFVVLKTPESPMKFKVAFAVDGVQSIFSDPSFKSFKDFVSSPMEKSAIVFPPHQFFNTRLFNSQIDNVFFPKSFNVGQLTKMASNFKNIPFVAFFDKTDFEHYHFDNIYDFGKFAVFSDFIEPVVENPVPVLIKNSMH